MEKPGSRAPSDIPEEQAREQTELEEKYKMPENLQAVVDREKKRLALELQLAHIGEQLQQLGPITARSDECGLGSGGAARGGVVVSGLKARGATASFWSDAGAEDQYHQSPAGSYPGSQSAGQAPVEGVLRRDSQWGKGCTISGFDPERESAAHFNVSVVKIQIILTSVEVGEI